AAGRARSQVRSDVDVELELGIRIVQAVRHVDAHRANRRLPARADPHAGVQVRSVVERAAGIDEDRRAPRAAIEVALVFNAAGHHALAAERVLVRWRRARADFAEGITADAVVAAGEEAQAWRHRDQVGRPG